MREKWVVWRGPDICGGTLDLYFSGKDVGGGGGMLVSGYRFDTCYASQILITLDLPQGQFSMGPSLKTF